MSNQPGPTLAPPTLTLMKRPIGGRIMIAVGWLIAAAGVVCGLLAAMNGFDEMNKANVFMGNVQTAQLAASMHASYAVTWFVAAVVGAILAVAGHIVDAVASLKEGSR